MKSDALTAAAVVFLIGVLVSGLGIKEHMSAKPKAVAPSDLQQGFLVTR